MRIAMLTMGSVGDVQPMTVLGGALRSRGHDVVLVTSPEYRTMAERAGLELRSLPAADGYVTAVLASDRVRAALRKGPSKIRMGLAAPPQSFRRRRELTDEMLAGVADADLLVHTLFVRIVALDWPDMPSCLVPPYPATATGEWPALGTPALPLGRRYNRFTHRAVDALEWSVMRHGINKVRRQEGRPALGRRSPYRADGVTRPVLYAFSPQIFPSPPDWPAQAHITGAWTATAGARSQEPPAALTAFLDRGEPPLVASYGSALLVDGPGLLGTTVEAARLTGHRLVIVGGPAVDVPAPVEAIQVERADFGVLLPRAAAVLYHGGPGTAGAAISAGVPHVTVPTFGDQPMWARRLADIGVAAPPVPYHRLTADRLAAAIRSAVSDPGIAARAAAMAETARDDGGVERAADVIETYAMAGAGLR